MLENDYFFLMVVEFAVSKQEKVKDYPWVEIQVNSALRLISVTKVIFEIKRLVEAKAYRKKFRQMSMTHCVLKRSRFCKSLNMHQNVW